MRDHCKSSRHESSGQPTVTIAPGVEMPLVGLGTWDATSAETYAAVRRALELGYRHIDTATMYRNEDAVGARVRDSGLRDEVFVTTKLPPGSAGRERATIDASLAALGLDQVDLWLIHWPPDGQARPDVWEQFVEIARGRADARDRRQQLRPRRRSTSSPTRRA